MMKMIRATRIRYKAAWLLSTAALMILAFSVPASGQSEKKLVREGNREYNKKKYSDSEISYRKAADKNKNYPDAVFNSGDALYRQNKFEEAGKQFMQTASMNEDKEKKSEAIYNLGNSLLKANKVEESIEAYKNSLKINPENKEAKYNLAYAQDLLKKQQEQKQQNKDNKDQNKDKQDQKKDQKDKQDQKDQKKDQQKDDKQQDQDKQQPQQQQQGMSKDDAERLLNALANEEKNVQEKVKLAKAAKEKVRTVKNW
jgi:Ca-activated chloride channel homolog